MQANRRWLRGFVVLLLSTVSIVASGAVATAADTTSATGIRWDLVSNDFVKKTASPGGQGSALANDGSKITLTGSGTFTSTGVTGGGAWKTFDPSGAATGTGAYQATGLVSWLVAPGTFPPILDTDNIGNKADARAGLAVLRIAFSDGSQGVLTISCNLPGAPASLFEGITVSKGFVDYWNRVAPPDPPADANRNVFHALPGTAAATPMPAVSSDTGFRWDLVNNDFVKKTASPGGHGSALANDSSKITLTGLGTFTSAGVTGGGTWTTYDPSGATTGTGAYQATGLVSWQAAPGTFPPILDTDNIGNKADARAGLAVFRIAYSDGSQGVMTISCNLNGTPASVFEGLVVSKGFVDYWNRVAPPDPPADANRNVFHALPGTAAATPMPAATTVPPTKLPSTGGGGARTPWEGLALVGLCALLLVGLGARPFLSRRTR